MAGSSLKIIALICMLIDHIGVGLVGRAFISNDLYPNLDWYFIYKIMRAIGRIAFPIFIYLLIEGYYKTRDKKKFFRRLVLFALISEIPFDLVFNNKILEYTYQNIFFELSLIVILLYFLEKFDNIFLKLLSLIIISGLAHYTRFDYKEFGIFAAFIMHALRGNNKTEALSILPAFLFESNSPSVFLASIPIYFYNGKRGLKLKYFFYLFYPFHLFIIYLIRIFILRII